MVNCMKGKGWRPVVFDPAVVYNTDGTQQSGPEPIEALWPWHGEEPVGGWPEETAQDAAPPAGNADSHQGKGYGSFGPPRKGEGKDQLGTPARVSSSGFRAISALCLEQEELAQRTRVIDAELAEMREEEQQELLLQEQMNAGCEVQKLELEGKARQAALADAKAVREAARNLEIAKGNEAGRSGKGKEQPVQRRWNWCPPVEAAKSKTPPGTPRSPARSPKGRPLDPSPEDALESHSRRKKEQDRELLRSAEGNAKAAGASQDKLALLRLMAKETQAELRAQQEEIAILQDAARDAREAKESDEALELVRCYVSMGEGSASSDNAPPGNVYGAVPPPANDEDEPGPSDSSKRGMGAMD